MTIVGGLIFVALIGWRLIPAREDALIEADDIAEYIAELTVPEGNKQIGKRLAELQEEAHKADVAILGLMRDGKRRYGTARNVVLQAGDAIVLEATPDALDEFRSTLNLALADRDRDGRRALGRRFISDRVCLCRLPRAPWQ